MTSQSLAAIGRIGGPRCCKRNGFLAMTEAVAYAAEHLGVTMETPEIICRHWKNNNQCIGKRCPFHKAAQD